MSSLLAAALSREKKKVSDTERRVAGQKRKFKCPMGGPLTRTYIETLSH